MIAAAGIDLVLERLARAGHPARKSGLGWSAKCPAHDDGNPSLSISVGKDQPVILNCHTGCDTDRILAALDLTWQDVCREVERPQQTEIVVTYPYVDEEGELLFQVCRLEPKSFRQRRPNGVGGWVWGLADTRRVLYRLPAVMAAIAAGETVFVVEGEKDADRLARDGHAATCNPMGAGKWRAEHTAVLADADVVIVADRDKPGRVHAAHVAASLTAVAKSLVCCEPHTGNDLSDHLNAGLTLDDLDVVADEWANLDPQPESEAPSVTDWLLGDDGPPPEVDLIDEPTATETAIGRLRDALLTGAEISKIPARRSLVKGWLDLCSLAMLYGRPASGKSLVAMDLALSIAIGSWWHGARVRHAGDVLYVVAEGASGVGDRQTAWMKQNKVFSSIDRLHWLPLPVNLLDPVAATALTQIAVEVAPVLVVIDTLARSMPGGDENSGKDMGPFIEAADRIKRETGACVLIVHHSGKDETRGARGWSGLFAAVDTELELKSAENRLTLSATKQKDSAVHMPARFTLVAHRWTCPDCDGAGVGSDGDECDRCDGDKEIGHVAVATMGRHMALEAEVSESAHLSLEALASIDAGDGVTSAQWLEVAVAEGVARSSHFKHRKQLQVTGVVKKVGTRFAIVNDGSEAA